LKTTLIVILTNIYFRAKPIKSNFCEVYLLVRDIVHLAFAILKPFLVKRWQLDRSVKERLFTTVIEVFSTFSLNTENQLRKLFAEDEQVMNDPTNTMNTTH
jgi:hypothetical protein